MMWHDGGPGWGGWILMSFGMIAFWTLVVVAVIALVRGLQSDQGRPPRPPADARQLLDERFARGEIDAEEYKARRDLLGPGAERRR
ncbi:MAG TPA: SHOCT domain-containing protein [Nocardioidaceae bacterium]